jgi:hypothetical protein
LDDEVMKRLGLDRVGHPRTGASGGFRGLRSGSSWAPMACQVLTSHVQHTFTSAFPPLVMFQTVDDARTGVMETVSVTLK